MYFGPSKYANTFLSLFADDAFLSIFLFYDFLVSTSVSFDETRLVTSIKPWPFVSKKVGCFFFFNGGCFMLKILLL